MNLEFKPSFEKDLECLSKNDSANKRKVQKLILDILEHPFEGIGKPEPLKYEWSGCWSRRLDKKNRLIYKVTDDTLILFSCRSHY